MGEPKDDDLVAKLARALDEEDAVRPTDPAASRDPDSRKASVSEEARTELPDELTELKEKTKKSLPNFVFSIIFHLILIAILSLIIFMPYTGGLPELVYETAIVFEFEREELGKDTDSPHTEEAQDEAAPTQNIDAPEVEVLKDEGQLAKVVSDNVTNRFGKAKDDALRRFGGSPGSERAVRQGLLWLAAHQDSSGLWNPYRYQLHCPSMSSCLGAAAMSHGDLGVGVSGLAMLAFAGNAQTPKVGQFRETVARGMKALLSSQDGAGCFGGPVGKKYMYCHALALLAVVEMYGLTGDEEIKEAATRGLEFLRYSQQRRDGGWNYSQVQGKRSDTSVTGWCILVLKAARASGLEVSEECWNSSLDYIKSMTDPDGAVRYCTAPFDHRNPGETEQRGVSMLSVGLASRLFLGESRTDSMVRQQADRVQREPPDAAMLLKVEASAHEMYYWYYGTLAMFQMGGSYWTNWNDKTRDMLVGLQRLDGHAGGSWDPPNSFGGREAGRIYSTAINVLILETYYRYLPLYATLKDEIGEKEGAPLPVLPEAADESTLDFAGDAALAPVLARLEGGSLLARIGAVRELGLSESPLAAPLLRVTYQRETDLNMRANLLKALAQQGGTRSYAAFQEALASESEMLRQAALEELPRLTGEQGARDLEAWQAYLQQHSAD